MYYMLWKKRYEDTVRVWCNVGSLTKLRGSGEGRVKCTGKKRYITLEWPIYTITHTAVSFFIS